MQLPAHRAPATASCPMPLITMSTSLLLFFLLIASTPTSRGAVVEAFHSLAATSQHHHRHRRRQHGVTSTTTPPPPAGIFAPSPSASTLVTSSSASMRLYSSSPNNRPTELPDSLVDAAAMAANACHQLLSLSSSAAGGGVGGPPIRCRVDFDTSVGDETYTPLKRSSEFMLSFVNAVCLASVDGVMEWKQECVVRVIEAKKELRELQDKRRMVEEEKEEEDEERRLMAGFDGKMDDTVIDEDEGGDTSNVGIDDNADEQQRESELLQIIASEGKLSNKWNGKHTLRIYFPDEGSAALARRDWTPILPPCVVYDACGGVASRNMKEKKSDVISIFYCPRASEAESVEKLLMEAEESIYSGSDEEEEGGAHRMTIMVNPLLVDMGVTGFGMAGRRLRERLIDGLIPAYYLRTLVWGALTRCYPNLFTVWMEDENADGGYRMIQAMDRLPSNPEVEDIYDIATGNMNAPKEGMGFLNALGDFVNGMTRL
ncbi:hypothetical protein ACHAXH_005121 [Discostella pseudostelligera]